MIAPRGPGSMSDRECGRGDRLISVSVRFSDPLFELQSWGRHHCRSRFCATCSGNRQAGTLDQLYGVVHAAFVECASKKAPAVTPGLGLNACRSFGLETE